MEQAQSDIKNIATLGYQRGVLTLMSVLLVGAIGLAVGVSLVLLGLAYSKTSLALQQSNQARALADACAEEALQQINTSNSYTGSGSLTLGQGSCSYTVANTGGTTRKITASGTVGSVIRKVQITIGALSPSIVIWNWQEVADFN